MQSVIRDNERPGGGGLREAPEDAARPGSSSRPRRHTTPGGGPRVLLSPPLFEI